jgi:hypothetical protein
MIVLLALLCLSVSSVSARADQVDHVETERAAQLMVDACRKEYPHLRSKDQDAIDHWAESSEKSETFRKSKCFELHEAWEKLALRNEWAPGSTRKPATR